MLGRYGDAAAELLDSAPEVERGALPGTRTCLAQVRWALRHESVVHLDDLMLRRTRLGLLLENGGDAILEDIRRLFVEIFDWPENEWQSELARYRDIIRQHCTLPVGALP